LNKRLIYFIFLAQCTDLCSGHGVIEHGQCRCQEGWHGIECQLMLNQCEIANCNNRGSCIAGKCVCQNGYQGKFCEQSKTIPEFENIIFFFSDSFMSKCQL
jgi:syndecan 4